MRVIKNRRAVKRVPWGISTVEAWTNGKAARKYLLGRISVGCGLVRKKPGSAALGAISSACGKGIRCHIAAIGSMGWPSRAAQPSWHPSPMGESVMLF